MQGRRLPDGSAPWNMEPGDYVLYKGHVWVRLPSGAGPAKLDGWEHIVNEDGTFTVTPSIHDVGHESGWHGYLTDGVWAEC